MALLRPDPPTRRGRVLALKHRSEVLQGNPWGDPVERTLPAYLPAAYEEGDDDYPLIVYLAAYTNSGRSISNWRGFGENLVERLDRLIDQGRMGPAIVIAPDCFTSLGGNQYVDSAGIGAYETYVHDELVPFVAEELRVLPGARHRAVVGKSSGGYGALSFALRRPGAWGAVASQSADCHFDVTVRRDFPVVASTLARHGGDPAAFLRAFWQSSDPSGAAIHTLMFLCLAASYDPQSDGSLRLPFEADTLELIPERWENWLAADPLSLPGTALESLRGLRALYLDCGNRDQYQLHYGMRLMSRRLAAQGIAHHYEEFDGSHSGIDWRLDLSLPYLYEAIRP